jgi:hypothetical protein
MPAFPRVVEIAILHSVKPRNISPLWLNRVGIPTLLTNRSRAFAVENSRIVWGRHHFRSGAPEAEHWRFRGHCRMFHHACGMLLRDCPSLRFGCKPYRGRSREKCRSAYRMLFHNRKLIYVCSLPAANAVPWSRYLSQLLNMDKGCNISSRTFSSSTVRDVRCRPIKADDITFVLVAQACL